MSVFTVFVNVAGRGKMEVGNVAVENPDLKDFESVEVIELDAESPEDAISLSFVPA